MNEIHIMNHFVVTIILTSLPDIDGVWAPGKLAPVNYVDNTVDTLLLEFINNFITGAKIFAGRKQVK